MEEKRKITLQAQEVQQFSNALDLTIRALSEQPEKAEIDNVVIQWAGWQLGQLRRHSREFQDELRDPIIVEMQNAKARDGVKYDPAKFIDAQSAYDAALSRECVVSVCAPTVLMDCPLPAVFAKVLSFIVSEED